MKNKWLILLIAVHIVLIGASFMFDKEPLTTQTSYAFTIDTIATDLVVPWEIVFLPDKTMLFTERDGKVRIYRNKQLLDKPALQVNALLNKKQACWVCVFIPIFLSITNFIWLITMMQMEE